MYYEDPNESPLSEEKLLPCPFCGGEAIVEEYGRKVFLSKCTACGIKFPIIKKTKEEAIKAWNTRTGAKNEL